MESSAPYRTLGQGEMLNWYRIERILGRGGFGVIYFALDTNLDHHVAIKEYVPGDIARRDGDSRVLPLTEELGEEYHRGLERFIDEARNLVRFRHPNIVRVMSVFQENNTAYMVMEFEKGVELREHLATVPGARDEASLKRLLGPIVEGLAEVHRHGFVHRDIKPSNILVRDDGSPVLLDFGSARNAGRLDATQNLTALVSAGYAPLEQYGGEGNDGQQGPWTDIYALGGVLYHAVSGSDPVDSTRRASAAFNGGRDPLLPATLVGQGHYDDAFLRAIDWALSFRIADRPQTLSDWLPALMSGTRPAGELPLPSFGSAAGSATVVSRRGSERPHAPTRPADHPPGTTSGADVADATIRRRLDRGASDTPPTVRRPIEGRVRRTAVGLAVAAVLGGTLWFVSGDSRVVEFVAAQRVPVDDGGTTPGTDAADVSREDRAAQARAAEAVRAAEAERQAERVEAARVAEEARLAEATRASERESARVAEQARLAEEARSREEREAADARAAERSRREEADRTREAEAARVAEAEVEAEAEAKARAEADEARAARAAEVARLVRERRAREAEAAEREEAAREAEATRAADAARAIEAARRAEEQKAREAATAARRAEAARAAEAAAIEPSPVPVEPLARVETPTPIEPPAARPVSDDDIGLVMGRFEALRRAIASRDASAMDALTEASPQNRLFRQLMGDYVELDVAIGDIRVRNADQAITATLAIRGMVRENGDRALPSDAYAEREIASVRRDDEWSAIDW